MAPEQLHEINLSIVSGHQCLTCLGTNLDSKEYVSPLGFTLGTLVLCNRREVQTDLPRPKYTLLWEEPYVIFEDVGNRWYNLNTVDGDDVFFG